MIGFQQAGIYLEIIRVTVNVAWLVTFRVRGGNREIGGGENSIDIG